MQVLSGFEDGSLALWDERQPGQALAAARGHSEPVMCLHVGGRPRGDEVPHDDEGRRPGAGDGPASRQRQKQRGGMTASSGSADDTLCFWSLSGEAEDGGAAAEEVEEVIGHGGEQGGMARSAAGGAGGTAGCVCGALRKVHEVKLPVPGCNHLACSADGRVLASAGWDGKVRLFSASKKRRPLAVLEYHSAQVRGILRGGTCLAARLGRLGWQSPGPPPYRSIEYHTGTEQVRRGGSSSSMQHC